MITDLSCVYHGIMPRESLTSHSGDRTPIACFEATRGAKEPFAYKIRYRLNPTGPE